MTSELESRPLERSEGAEGVWQPEALQSSLRESALAIGEAIVRGETYESQERPLMESLHDVLESSFEYMRDLAGTLEALARELVPVLGDFGETVAEGLDAVEEILGRGVEWLREHPEATGAVLQLVILGCFAAYRPEAFVALMQDRPELLTSRIDALAHALS